MKESERIEQTERVKKLFEGEYVFFVEYSYRRVSDFLNYTDTTYILYHTLKHMGAYSDLELEIGGPRVVDRLKAYMRDGPLLSINVERDQYVIYGFSPGFPRMRIVKEIPRE